MKIPVFLKSKLARPLILLISFIPLSVLFNKLNNHVYPLFIFAFILLTIYFVYKKKQSYSLLIIPILFILFFNTRSFSAINQIKIINSSFLTDPETTIKEIFTPNSGQYVLDDHVLWMLSIIQKYDLHEFKLSPAILEDFQTKERIIESAWPIKNEIGSKDIFLVNDELYLNPECKIVDHFEEYRFVQCP